MGGAQTVWVVSPEGDDTADGSFEHPFRNIGTALEKARRMPGHDITVFLRAGTYRLDAPLVFTPVDGQAITLSGWRDEPVTVCGSRQLALRWRKSHGPVWESPLELTGFDRLFVNGQERILARYPDYREGAVYNGTAADALSPGRVKRWKNPAGGFIHAIHRGRWGDMHYVITGKRGKELLFEGGFQNNRPSPPHPELRFVENIYEELDSPGEWYADAERKKLYYYPPEGEDVRQVTVEAAVLSGLVEIRGERGRPVRNVTLRNIRFAHTARTFMKPYEPLLRSDWCIYRGAAVLIENAQDCAVENCEFTELGGNAVFVSRYALHCRITGNHIHRIGASAVCVVGDTSAVRSGAMRYERFVPYGQMDKTPGPANGLYPRQCVVDDNLIHDIGRTEKQVAGVQIQVASEIRVSRNTVYRVPRAAFNIGDGAFGGHVLEYNDAFETVLETSDHGAFNSWGRDRYWHPDYAEMCRLAEAHPELIRADALRTTVIRNNRFRCDHGWDIDLDDGSLFYHIYNNLCLSGGIKLREGFGRTVENNIVLNNSLHPHVWFPRSGDVVRRNIFTRPYFPIAVQGWGEEADYNFFPSAACLEEVRQYGTDAHSVCGPLVFRDAAAGDFTVPDDAVALTIGFENFPTDRFGVHSEALKRLAERPEIPPLRLVTDRERMQPCTWLDATVRTVDGAGDRSAYGLPDETGAIVELVPPHSALARADVRKNDVIRSIRGERVADTAGLLALTDKYRWTGSLEVVVIRNQQEVTRVVSLARE